MLKKLRHFVFYSCAIVGLFLVFSGAFNLVGMEFAIFNELDAFLAIPAWKKLAVGLPLAVLGILPLAKEAAEDMAGGSLKASSSEE